MWAQYADKHRGFCLVFEKSKLLGKIADQLSSGRIFHGRVSYIDRSFLHRIEPNAFRIEYDHLVRVGIDAYCSMHVSRYAKELYFDKLRDWRDECEWRVVLFDKDCPPPLIRFEEALVGVMHGEGTSRDDSKAAVALTPETSIEHIGLKWQNHCPWYDLGNDLRRRS